MKGCVNMTKRSDKYKFRNSPPYPANECKGMKKKGNDGNYYTSEKIANGVYRWKAILLSGRKFEDEVRYISTRKDQSE